MILDIRGTHGSGKSHSVRLLLKRYKWGHPIEENGEHLGYRLPQIDCAVVARYTEFGGGCDGVKHAEEVARRVRLFASIYEHVVFEGVLISHTYERYARLAEELGKERYKFLFLDTPLETCIRRVNERRASKGNTKPLDPKNIVKDHHCDWDKLRPKFAKNGYNVSVLDHKQPLVGILNALGIV